MNRRQFSLGIAAAMLGGRTGGLRRLPVGPLPPQPPDLALSDEALGWLAHLHRKVTLGGTWTKEDTVGPQWDTTSFVPTMGYARYEPTWLAWSMGLMVETTPAWREEYQRVLGFLSDRLMEYWSIYEWIEHRGDDPGRADYPAGYRVMIPDGWFGRYNLPGWAGNGSRGHRYDPDPIRAGGQFGLMYKGYLNLVLSMYAYVADDGKYERPFTVTYDERNQWRYTQRQLNALLAEQWRAHEEGIACEVTKVYPWCNTLSGAGVRLYDGLRGTRFVEAYYDWQRYYLQHYVGSTTGSEPDWLMGYFDPDLNVGLPDRGRQNGGNWMATAWHGLAADPGLFEPLARSALRIFYREGTGGGYFSANGAADVDLNIVTGLGAALAAELGDEARHRQAREWIMTRYQPVWDRARGEFAFGFGLDEPWPRGQLNAWVMPALLVTHAGQWRRLFQTPNTTKFSEPTVEGVDFPTVRVRQARFDRSTGHLQVAITTMDERRRGQPTHFRVARLPIGSRPVVIVDDRPGRPLVADQGVITVDTTVGDHRITVAVPG